MKNIIIIILISLFILGFSSCKKNPVEPSFPDDGGVTPGKRDYTWAADTIKNPLLVFTNIWGNSLTNIWVAGVQASNALYKYNGTSWALDNRVYLPTPRALWGHGNKVWIGNYNGCIWQFAGDSYQEQVTFYKLGDEFVVFGNMDGSSEQEIYVTGAYYVNSVCYAIIMKYDGTSWKNDRVFDNPSAILQFKYSPRNDRYYLTTSNPDNSETVYEYDRKNLKEICSYPSSNTGPTLAVIDGYAYIVIENKIYRYVNDKMEPIAEVSLSNFGGVVWGRSRNDIFVRMHDGLAHYNGTDVQYLFKTTDNTAMAPNMAIFDKDVFVNVKDFNTGYNIIYHGTLK
jgi:hypothetical protein